MTKKLSYLVAVLLAVVLLFSASGYLFAASGNLDFDNVTGPYKLSGAKSTNSKTAAYFVWLFEGVLHIAVIEDASKPVNSMELAGIPGVLVGTGDEKKGNTPASPLTLNGDEYLVTAAVTDLGLSSGSSYRWKIFKIEGVPLTSSFHLKLTTSAGGFDVDKNVTVLDLPEPISVTATKVWDGGPEPRPEVTLKLYRNDEFYKDSDPLSGVNWEYTWPDLEKNDDQGEPYVYDVREEAPENYAASSEETSENNWTVTNTYSSPLIWIKTSKRWINGPKVKPDTYFQLWRESDEVSAEKVGSYKLLAHPATRLWWEVEETDQDGNPFDYWVEEVDEDGDPGAPDNYVRHEEGLRVTNTYVKPKVNVAVEKEWVGGPEEHGNVKIQLLRNDKPYGKAVTLSDSKLTHVWEDLDGTNRYGDPYTYSVKEMKVPKNYEVEYSTKEDGTLLVTNSYVIPMIKIKVMKKWVNGPDNHEPVDLQLFLGDVPVDDTLVELSDTKTKHTWTVPGTDGEGNPLDYRIVELTELENYESSVGYSKWKRAWIVTNTYVIPIDNITATKEWVGGPSDHPDIELQLYQDGVEYGDPVLLSEGKTEHTWPDLEMTDINGKLHDYTVDEVEVPDDYEKDIDGLTITNTYVIPKGSKTATKEWVGGPSSHPDIQLQLLRDGVKHGEPVLLASGQTEYTWPGLELTDGDGVPYEYTVDEVAVPADYEKDLDGMTITNTYTKVAGAEDEKPEETVLGDEDKKTPATGESLPSFLLLGALLMVLGVLAAVFGKRAFKKQD